MFVHTCSLHLASIGLVVCPKYILLHSHGISHTPRTYRSNPTLAGLSIFMVFLFWAMNSSDIVVSRVSHDFVADIV